MRRDRAPDCIDALRVDLPVEDGDQIPLDGDTIRIIALPGHTRCCIGFYLETHQILLAPETLGVPIPSGTVMPAYLVGYQMTLDAIAKAAQLPLRELLVSHAGMLYGPGLAPHFCSAAPLAAAKGATLFWVRTTPASPWTS